MTRRILIYGVTGSGKSTLAAKISERTGIPWYPVDDLAFEPGWKQVPDDVQREKISAIIAEPEWILDSAYAKWLDLILPTEPLIVALDYPRWVSFGRLLRRTISRAVDKTPVCNGNVETWRLMFSRESILLWHFRSFKRKRARIHLWSREGRHLTVHGSPKETEHWLSQFGELSARE